MIWKVIISNHKNYPLRSSYISAPDYLNPKLSNFLNIQLIHSGNLVLIHANHEDFKWMVQCHKDVYENLRLRLEYAYLLFNKFILNRINSELIEVVEFWCHFQWQKVVAMTHQELAKKIREASFGEIRKQILSSFWL